jgi:hypothetical protein
MDPDRANDFQAISGDWVCRPVPYFTQTGFDPGSYKSNSQLKVWIKNGRCPTARETRVSNWSRFELA